MNVSDDDVVEAVAGVDDPVATVAEVAERLPIGRRAVLKRLNELHDEGRVERKDVGARSAVWWVPGSVERTDALERTSDERTDPVDRAPDELEAVDVDDDLVGEVDPYVLDLPGSGSRLEERREAVIACYEYLREHGEGKRSIFENEVFPEYPGGYQSAYSWWNNCVIEGLKQVAKIDDGVEVPDYSGRWQYHG
jgi:DNA-binding Lrp family transcriptional regulator